MDPTATSATSDGSPSFRTSAKRLRACLCAGALALLPACEGDSGSDGAPAPGAETPTDVAPTSDAPALVVAITELRGGSGPSGAFRPGDRITVRFTLEKADGSPWMLSEMSSGEALVSGPTFNYQRVLPLGDVLATARDEGNGSFAFSFAERIPATFLAPLNDSPTFGPDDGERTGDPLLAGTYTLGLSFAWDYTVSGTPFQQVGEATIDFLLGSGAGALTPRDVTRQENCNACHVELRAHEGRYRNLILCLMCHTSGAEDANDPAVAGGTPDISLDARVFFHKLHNGRQLPSVLGVGTNADGSRNYAVTPRAFETADADGNVHDFSDVGWPGMPNRVIPMPQDFGYTALTPAEQDLEDRMRAGVVDCAACHGDPDGSGPLEAPTQGDQAFFMMTRRACGSCHDDVDFELPYRAQNQTMPPQPDDTRCISCHDSTLGGALAARDGHDHPLRQPSFFGGLDFEILSLSESGNADGDGTVDPGEKIRATFTLQDDAGLDVDASTLDSVRVIVSGPTTNLQTLLVVELPPVLLSGPQPYVGNLPWVRRLEFLGDASAAPGEAFGTAFTPHLVGTGILSEVLVRTGNGVGSANLTGATAREQNFVDVTDATGFARDDHVVIDDGVAGREEYARIQFVDGNRLWFSSPTSPDYPPGLESPHANGAAVAEVLLTTLTEGVDYSLDPLSGQITELIEFGAGAAVLASYTTEFVVPDRYPAAPNGSPDLDDTTGNWQGKALVDGTYVVGISGYQDLLAFAMGELTPNRASSRPATAEFLLGSALVHEPYDLISSGQNCNACHQDLTYHGGRDRGFDTCILCHGSPGAEDLPRYVAANAPETSGRTVNFRSLLHKIHRGSELTQSFSVVGSGSDPYPDNFEVRAYDNYVFPALTGRTKDCAKCHGAGPNLIPRGRDHPAEQNVPVRAWREACASCHDAGPAIAHMDANTSPGGFESCDICHGAGEPQDVSLVHKVR